MCRICVFAGTSEGRRLVEFLGGSGAEVCACVATDYGEALLPRQGNVEVHTGRLDEKAMEALFRDRCFDLIVDATHPFATQASGFIAAACDAAGVEYLRLNREEADGDAEAIRVGTMEEAAEYLADHPGNALLTTGSKALRPFAALAGFSERFYVRVLPRQAFRRRISLPCRDPSPWG